MYPNQKAPCKPRCCINGKRLKMESGQSQGPGMAFIENGFQMVNTIINPLNLRYGNQVSIYILILKETIPLSLALVRNPLVGPHLTGDIGAIMLHGINGYLVGTSYKRPLLYLLKESQIEYDRTFGHSIEGQNYYDEKKMWITVPQKYWK